MLGVQSGDLGDKFYCVDTRTKKVLFQEKSYGFHSHHWVMHNEQKYLSLQTRRNMIEMYQVDAYRQFSKADESLCLSVAANEKIAYVEFDRDFEHIFILKNLKVLEKRNMLNLCKVQLSIVLE